MRSAIRRRVASALHRSGYTVSRSLESRLVTLMEARRVSVVFDVGANNGQFATSLRKQGYTGRIVSFEPVATAFEELSRVAASDTFWEAIRTALGSSAGELPMNIASNRAASSSFLPMLDAHHEAAPEVHYRATETVPVARLDDLSSTMLEPHDVLLLKIDTQGYEREVLAGGQETLRRAEVVLMEVSFVELYAGSMLVAETLDLMESAGFVLAGMDTMLRSPSGQALQADATFLRSE
jgi:FkbM family methyltransferase